MYVKNVLFPAGWVLVFLANIYSFLFAIVPNYIDFRIHENVGINFHRAFVSFALACLFFLFFLSGSVRRSARLVFRSNRALFLIIGVYLAFRVLSFLVNPSVYSGLLLTNEILMNFCVLLFFSVSLVSTEGFRSFFNFSIMGALFVSFLVFFEAWLGVNFFSGLADVSTAVGKIAAESKYRDGSYRAQGAFEHPLVLAQYLLLVLPLLTSGFFFGRKKPIIIIVAFILIAAAWLTMARAFYVAILFGGIFYLYVGFLWGGRFGLSANSRVSIVLMSFPFVVAIFVYKLYEISLMGSAAEFSSTMTRLGQLYNGLIGIMESPFWGYGIGMAKDVIVNIGLSNPDAVVIWNETIDSFYLGLALESGLFALFSYMIFFAVSIFSGVSVYRDKRNSRFIRGAALSVSVSTFCAFVSMIVISIFTVLPFAFALVGVGCALSARSIKAFSEGVYSPHAPEMSLDGKL